jgi:hypothetical protein
MCHLFLSRSACMQKKIKMKTVNRKSCQNGVNNLSVKKVGKKFLVKLIFRIDNFYIYR